VIGENAGVALVDRILRVQAQQELALDVLVVARRDDHVVAGCGSKSFGYFSQVDVGPGGAASFQLIGVQATARALGLVGVRVVEDSVQPKLNRLFARLATIIGALFTRIFLQQRDDNRGHVFVIVRIDICKSDQELWICPVESGIVLATATA
jgi:hypothetical protein